MIINASVMMCSEKKLCIKLSKANKAKPPPTWREILKLENFAQKAKI